MGKRLGLLHELIPKATRFAALLADGQNAEFNITELKGAASVAGLQIELSKVSTSRDIDLAFTDFKRTQADALIVGPGALLNSSRVQVLMLATHHRMPAIYTDRIYADTGGLVTYGTNLRDQARQVGIYAGRILKGEKPFELPVMRAAKFELIINGRTARMLGLTIPPTLLATADEVIE
jgi:putative ABC transport system substrate-binding protein